MYVTMQKSRRAPTVWCKRGGAQVRPARERSISSGAIGVREVAGQIFLKVCTAWCKRVCTALCRRVACRITSAPDSAAARSSAQRQTARKAQRKPVALISARNAHAQLREQRALICARGARALAAKMCADATGGFRSFYVEEGRARNGEAARISARAQRGFQRTRT